MAAVAPASATTSVQLFPSAGTVTPGFYPTAATVPAGICFVQVNASGGAGASGYDEGGGDGAVVAGTVPVTPGVVLAVQVAGAGQGAQGGVGGGGGYYGGGGGGASVVSAAGTPLVVAGGGGGGSSTYGGGSGGTAGLIGGGGGVGGGVNGGDGGGGGGSGIGYGGGGSAGGGGSVNAGGTGQGANGGAGNGLIGGGGGGDGSSGSAGGQTGTGTAGPGNGGNNGGSGDSSGGNGGSGFYLASPMGSGSGGGGGGIGFGGGGGGVFPGGGGGAGYGGGGGGLNGGGGGGSSYVSPLASAVTSSATNTGGGSVSISYDPSTDSCVSVSAVGDSTPVSIDPSFAVPSAAAPNATYSSATVSVANFAPGDVLSLPATYTGPLTPTYSNGQLTLTGPATAAEFEQALRQVQYNSTVTDPTAAGTRPALTVTWQIQGGSSPSGPETSYINLSPAPATQLSLLDNPPGYQAGTPELINLEALDAGGHVATAFTGPQTATITEKPTTTGTYPPFTVSDGNTAVNAVAGKATLTEDFTNGKAPIYLTLYQANPGPTPMTLQIQNLQTAITPTTVTPATASTLSITTPAGAIAGQAANVRLTATDNWGNPATSLNGTQQVTFTGPATAPDGKAPLLPATINFTDGVATTPITVYDAQTTTLTATITGINPATTKAFTVAPAPASALAVSPPASITAGTTIPLPVAAVDAYGNVDTTVNGQTSFALTGANPAPDGTTATHPSTVTFVNGKASPLVTFYDAQALTVDGPDQSLAVTADNYQSKADTLAPAPFTVTPATASTLSITTPAGVIAGQAANVTLTATDNWGNPATSLNGTQQVTFTGPATAPDGKAPLLPATINFTDGVATTPITVYDAQTTTLTATITGINPATTKAFTVAPATTSQLALNPAKQTTAGQAFKVTVQAEDAYANPMGFPL